MPAVDILDIISESIVKALFEGISDVVFHYCSMENLLKMVKTDKLYFNKFEKEGNKGGMRALSTTRNRNSVQGYPYMQSGDCEYGGGTMFNGAGSSFYFIRIEFDGRALQNLQYSYRGKHTTLKGEPYDYIYHLNKDEFGDNKALNSREEIAQGIKDASMSDDELKGQPFSQAEDRIFSQKAAVDGFSKVVKRIDVLIRMDNLEKEINEGNKKEVFDFLNSLAWVMYKSGLDVHVYNNRGYFDHQSGKEMSGDDVISLLRRL